MTQVHYVDALGQEIKVGCSVAHIKKTIHKVYIEPGIVVRVGGYIAVKKFDRDRVSYIDQENLICLRDNYENIRKHTV